MQRSILFFSTLCGIILIVYVRLLDISGILYSDGWGRYLGYLAILILPLCTYFALRQVRVQTGPLSFLRSLAVSLSVAFIASTVYCIYIWADNHIFNASHLENTFEYEALEMKLAGRSEEEVTEHLKRLKEHYFSSKPYINTYTMYLAMGIVYGSVFYFVFRVKKPNP